MRGRARTIITLTYGELTRDVNHCASALRGLGISKGDRVALFMPMCPELVVAFFAVIKIGAVILPLFSGYGPDAVATRLNDAGAAAILVADGFWRRGQRVAMKAVADEALAAAPSVETSDRRVAPRGIGGDARGPRSSLERSGRGATGRLPDGAKQPPTTL